MFVSADYPPGYQPSEDKASKNLLGSATSMYIYTHTSLLNPMLYAKLT